MSIAARKVRQCDSKTEAKRDRKREKERDKARQIAGARIVR